ncbi:SusC/RagA family TonB-linked outer membrane protein [Chitinophaga barathri]|nr:SusC/RagA family TonB-linked outer membrane protein [Chitinophaga barathri]
MKLSAIIVFVVCMQASASVRGQNTISVKLSRTNLEKAFSLIELTTEYRFVYNDDHLPLTTRVSLDARNWPITKVLDQMLQNTQLSYRLMPNNLIVIAPAGNERRDVTAKGKVSSPSGEPLQMVSVRLKNTQIGTFTNEKGEFELKVPEEGILVFSYVGYESQELPVNAASAMQVKLEPNSNSMEEVIVVGYGTQRKINVTGAIDQIGGKQLAERPIANVFQGLQGLSPGLNITYFGGQPGQTPTINVRGFTSINGGSPLVIIDGIASATDDLLRLNPSDIASISVLRDAASAAIYGARAAYGVLLVTTKEGVSGGRQLLSYNNYFAMSRLTVLPEAVTDPYIYSRVLETATDNTPWDYVNYTDDHYAWAKQRSEDPSLPEVRVDPSDPNKWAYMGSNNWNDYFFAKSSPSQYHSISLSGSAENGKKLPVSYLLSADYTKENGLNKLTKDDWDRYGLRGKLNLRPLKWLSVDNNLNIYQTRRTQPTVNITDIYYLQPTDVAKNPDGTWANTGAGNLAARLTEGGGRQDTRFGFQNIAKATGTFLNGDLQITGDASFKRELWKYHTDSKKYSIGYGPNDIRQVGGAGYVTENTGNINHDVFDLFANYNKTFGKHAIKLLAGYNQESYKWLLTTSTRNGLISSSLPYIGLTSGESTITVPFGNDWNYAIRSFFGRVNYTYNDKYILELNGRYDGSSRFPESNRWGFFPSVSAAWIASEESFIKNNISQLSTLKLRASYGNLGNQSVDYFGYMQLFPKDDQSDYLIGGNVIPVITGSPTLQVDPRTYTWEKVTTANVGADVGIFKDKILAGFDYFVRNTTGMLTPGQELPGVLGTAVPEQNAADLRTKGWELSVNYRDYVNVGGKPLNFSVRAILSDSRTRITKFRNDQKLLNNYYEGQEIGELWGLTNDGTFKDAAEIGKLDQTDLIPWGAIDVVPGWPRYKDFDGNSKIERGFSANDPKDLRVIGNTSPRYRYGINLDMDWNGIDLSVFLQGIGKMDYYPHHYLYWGPYQQPYANIYPWNLDFYRGEADTDAERAKHSASYIAAGLADANPNAYFPVMQSWLADNNYTNSGGRTGLDMPQTKYLLNAAYLRIKNVTIGYTLPNSLTKRYKISRLRLFVSGENIFEFSSIKKYLDPESITDGYGWEYPYQRKYAAGLNLDL